MTEQNLDSNYEFKLVGDEQIPFKGYVSSIDPTNSDPSIMAQGSKNMYKKKSGTYANRPGRLLRGAVDATIATVLSAWVWNTSLGSIIPLRVCNGKLQFESNIANGIDYIWYTLLSGITLPRFVFDSWWDGTAAKDIMLAVHHTAEILSWSGGIAAIASATVPVSGALSSVIVHSGSGGSSYFVGDIIIIMGGNGVGSVQVTSTDGSGAVTGLSISNTGTGYSTGTNIGTTPPAGSGTGLTVDIISVSTTGSIIIAGTSTFPKSGFDPSGSVFINGNSYGYGSISADGKTLFGVLPDASAEPVGSVIYQQIVVHSQEQNTNSHFPGLPTAGFLSDFLKVIGNRVHLGSYSSRQCYISSSTSYINYTPPTPRTVGSPEILILDNTLKGISVSRGNAFIAAGTKDWYEVSYQALTVGSVATQVTSVDKKPTAENSAALAHEFIDTVGDDIVYLAQDQQVRVLGTFRNINTQKIPSISQEIYDELASETFISGFLVGELKAVGDFIYLIAPISGTMYIRQTREEVNEKGNVVAERLWFSPFINGAAKTAVINGVTYIHSNANPQIYQIWDTDQWHDDIPGGTASYTSVLQMAYRNYGRRQGRWKFNRVYVEGYATEGTDLLGANLVEFNGSNGKQLFNVNTPSSPATFTATYADSLGDASLGDNPLGDMLGTLGLGQQDLAKFRKISTLNPINFFEHGLILYSQNEDDRWEVLCLGTNAIIATDQQAGFISSGK